MNKFAFSLLLLPALAYAELPVVDDAVRSDEPMLPVAQPVPVQAVPVAEVPPQPVSFTLQELADNPALLHRALGDALFARDEQAIALLLPLYRAQQDIDPILLLFAEGKLAALRGEHSAAVRAFRRILAEKPELNVVRIELAVALFHSQQNKAAEDQFNKAKTAADLPAQVGQLIDAYLAALQNRSGWQFGASGHYVREDNVNGTSNAPEIEQTGYVKAKNMLPRKANGIAYSVDVSRDFNLFGSHYAVLQNDFSGRTFWDSHDDDSQTNRTLLGYAYKNARQTARLLPFFEQRWSGGSRYRHSYGLRGEYNHWLSPNWQLSLAAERGQQRYAEGTAQNGGNWLASATLLWLSSPQQFFYVGADVNRERVKVRQYSSDTNAVRLGWGREWQTFGLSSRMGLSFSQRDYKDRAKLGGVLDLGKVRSDKVYGVNLTLWKRDWHWLGITPKLQLSWRKHDSNLPTLYSYSDRNVNVVLESRF